MKNYQTILRLQKSFDKLFELALMCLFLASISGCQTSLLQTKQSPQSANTNQKTVVLPEGLENAPADAAILKKESCVISIHEDNVFYVGEERISFDLLDEKIKEITKDFAPAEQIVYVKSKASLDFNNIVLVLHAARRAGIHKAGLVVNNRAGRESNKLSRFEVTIEHNEPRFEGDNLHKSNPLVIDIQVDNKERVALNKEIIATLKDLEPLEKRLAEIFQSRTKNEVYIEGTNAVEKTINIKFTRSLAYYRLLELINRLNGAEAGTIILQLDDLDGSIK